MDNSSAESELNTYGGKKLHIEFLRIIACFFVIFNHTNENGFMLFSQYPDTSVQYWLYMFLSVFCKFAVAIFFAISGALLLKKEESIKTVYRRRVLKMCVLLLLVSAFYYMFNYGFNFSQMSLRRFVVTTYVSQQIVPLWYLYAFIPFLMALPLLRPMVKSLKNEHFLYMVICAVFFVSVLPITEYFIGKGDFKLNSNFRMGWITQAAVIYPFAGYYIENRMDAKRAKKYLPHLWAFNVLTIVITCVVSCYRARVTGDLTESGFGTFCSSFSLVNMMTIYITAKCLFDGKKVKQGTSKIICSMGACTLGIYLIHVAVIVTFNHFGVLNVLRDTLEINAMIACLIFCIAVFLVSYVLTLITKQIPGLKKLL